MVRLEEIIEPGGQSGSQSATTSANSDTAPANKDSANNATASANDAKAKDSTANALSANASTANASTANALSANASTANASTANALSANASTANAFSANASIANASTANALSADASNANPSTANAFSANASTANASNANPSTANALSANAPSSHAAAGQVTSMKISRPKKLLSLVTSTIPTRVKEKFKSKTLKTFTLFNKLPPELRWKIWELTYPGRRRIQQVPVNHAGPSLFSCLFNFRQAKAELNFTKPIALHICSESRDIAMKTYKPLKRVGQTREEDRSLWTWYDANSDVFDFQKSKKNWSRNVYVCPAYHILGSYERGHIESVTSLRFPLALWMCMSTGAIHDLKKFHGLKEIIIVHPVVKMWKMDEALLPVPESTVLFLPQHPEQLGPPGFTFELTNSGLKQIFVKAFRSAHPRWNGSVEGGKDIDITHEWLNIADADVKPYKPYEIKRIARN